VKPDATESEMTQMMEQGTDAPLFSQQALRRKTAQTEQAKAALLDIQQRHGEILRIERTVIELQQLFMDMAALVASQDEAIQDIAESVQKTVQYTEAGVEDLKSAAKHQKRSRRCMCTILACLLLLVAIIITVVLLLKK
jgi:t-SNARE complex subunit (syntaxin)